MKTLEYARSCLRGERNKIRHKHERKWRRYKKIMAPDSQVHHQWIPEMAEYIRVALVEADALTHGIIDVIKIIVGKITFFTKKEIREQEREHGSE